MFRVLKLIQGRLINNNFRIRDVDTELRIAVDNIEDFFILIMNNTQRFNLSKISNFLVWNLPIFQNEKIEIKIESKKLGSNEVLFTSNSVVVKQPTFNENFDIFDMDSDTNNIKIINKKIMFPDNYSLVIENDENNNLFTFENNRIDNGIDLSEMNIKINFINAIGEKNESFAINVNSTLDKLRFSWLLDNRVSINSGNVVFSIVIFGKNEKGDDYIWQSMPCTFKVNRALNQDDFIQQLFPSVIQDNKTRILNLEKRITELENKFNF